MPQIVREPHWKRNGTGDGVCRWRFGDGRFGGKLVIRHTFDGSIFYVLFQKKFGFSFSSQAYRSNKVYMVASQPSLNFKVRRTLATVVIHEHNISNVRLQRMFFWPEAKP